MTLKTPKSIPAERTILGALDTSARRTVALAKQDIAPIVARETPHKTGITAAALRPRIGRTTTGASLSVGAPRGKPHGAVTIAQVVRWVNRGTGLHRNVGGPGMRIHSNRKPRRPMVLPGGRRVWSVAGQKPNPFMGRIKGAADVRVRRAVYLGAQDASRQVARVIG